MGERPYTEVVHGVQAAVLHMGRGETARLVIKPLYAFGAKGNETFAVPAGATVEYTVTLHQFENVGEAWKLDETESVEQARVYKEKGTEQFRAGEWQLAVKLYEKSNSFLSNCCECSDRLISENAHDGRSKFGGLHCSQRRQQRFAAVEGGRVPEHRAVPAETGRWGRC